jgi:aconitate hydratase
MLRKHGVVGKFVEFYGEGVTSVSLANRTTIGNMSPEYGSTAAIFPIDEETLNYMRLTGRPESQLELVKAYAQVQGLWHNTEIEPIYSEYIELDLGVVKPSIAGPKRPQDRVELSNAATAFETAVATYTQDRTRTGHVSLNGDEFDVAHGSVVIAAITSCTNTSNPSVMMAAGLLAKKAVEKGLTRKPWVKTTLAPGSQVVTDYYNKSGLTKYLDALGFNLVGYGCTTCIGNSGPVAPEISSAIQDNDLAAVAVLSGNRNFEGRINPDVKMNYLASPPLVVAYAIAGTMAIDLQNDSLGNDSSGNPVYLRDIWPSAQEVADVIDSSIDANMFTSRYKDVFAGDSLWQNLETPTGATFDWDEKSTYVRRPPYFENMPVEPIPVTDVTGARVLAKLGDSVTTDHISPAGSIREDSPAGKYLKDNGVAKADFNSYGSRRGNHEVMIRGTFANIRLRNQLLEDVEGGFTRDFTVKGAPQTSIYEASVNAAAHKIPMIILAGKEYGSGSSRDWAAKGTALLGVRVVIAESYERIHRSNLIGMGVLPLQFPDGQSADSLGLIGTESFDVTGIVELNAGITPSTVSVTATSSDGAIKSFQAVVRIDTPGEADYFRHGGILQYVLRSLVKA